MYMIFHLPAEGEGVVHAAYFLRDMQYSVTFGVQHEALQTCVLVSITDAQAV